MNENNKNISIDDFAEELLMCDPADKQQLQKIRTFFKSFINGSDKTDAKMQTFIADCKPIMNSLLRKSAENAAKGLNAISEMIEKFGSVDESDVDEPACSGKFELPEYVDEELFNEYLSSSRLVLEEVEANILNLESGGAQVIDSLKRILHTMKGEAGVLSLVDLEKFCHGVEDFIESDFTISIKVDRLLEAQDWIVKALESYASGEMPLPSASHMLEEIRRVENADRGAVEVVDAGGQATEESVEPEVSEEELERRAAAAIEAAMMEAAPDFADDPSVISPSAELSAEPATEPTTEPTVETNAEPNIESTVEPMVESTDEQVVEVNAEQDSSPPSNEEKPEADSQPSGPSMSDLDEDTIMLMSEFLEETAEGLAEADQILMSVDTEGANPDKVNALFRTFHTIKGVAGFLELFDITTLAHTTETMLNQVREEIRAFEGVVIDLVFDSTDMMKKMLDDLKSSIESGDELSAQDSLHSLLGKINAVIKGEVVFEEKLPEVEPGDKLGDILPRQPSLVPVAAINDALQSQKESGRKLGEELVAKEVVKPKEVSRALRAQKKAETRSDSAGSKIRETVKIDLERVDSFVDMIGELVIVESMVVNCPEIAAITSPTVRNYLSQLEKITRDLQDNGMQMRMVPVRGVFQKMARMVRDLARKGGKEIRMVPIGEATEMDRSMVEHIVDPLVHMIRNAVDHAIEPADEREKLGKTRTGTVTLSAYHEGGSIVVEISDDGRGLNKEAIIKKAVTKGLISSSDNMSDSEIFKLIFAPGFSTAAQVTEISGRGVGMDVVRKNIEAMRGRITISSKPGEGSVFKMILPLTLAIIDGMLVACGDENYIIPTLSIIESIQPDADMLVTYAERGELLNMRGEIIPLLRLDKLFDISDAQQNPTSGLVVIVEGMGRRFGLLVDEVLTQQQVVIKTLSEGVGKTDLISGAAILSNGRVGLILNIDSIGVFMESKNGANDKAPVATKKNKASNVPAGTEQVSTAAK